MVSFVYDSALKPYMIMIKMQIKNVSSYFFCSKTMFEGLVGVGNTQVLHQINALF